MSARQTSRTQSSDPARSVSVLLVKRIERDRIRLRPGSRHVELDCQRAVGMVSANLSMESVSPGRQIRSTHGHHHQDGLRTSGRGARATTSSARSSCTDTSMPTNARAPTLRPSRMLELMPIHASASTTALPPMTTPPVTLAPRPDARVVADLHVVVDLDVVLDDGGRHGSLLHDGQGPNLDRVPDNDAAKMGDSSLVAGLVAHESETLGPDDRVRPDDGSCRRWTRADRPARPALRTATSSNCDVWTDRAERLDHDALTDLDVALDDRERRDDRAWRDLPRLDPWRLPMLVPDERQDAGNRRTRSCRFQHTARSQPPCDCGAVRRDDDAAVSGGESLANGDRQRHG